MKIIVNPAENQKLTGVSSMISFDNPAIITAFHKMFDIRKVKD